MAPHTVSKKTKRLLGIALLLSAVAIGWYVFLFTEVKAKNESVSTLINDIEANETEEETHSSIKTIAAQTVEQRKALQNYTIAREGAVSFIELLERTGRNIGVDVTIATVRETEIAGSATFEHLTLALTAAGTWPRIIQFIGLLEFLPYEADITQAVVSKSGKQAGLWSLSLSLSALKEK